MQAAIVFLVALSPVLAAHTLSTLLASRRLWKRVRAGDFFQVCQRDDVLMRTHFRMGRATFSALVHAIGGLIAKSDTNYRQSVPPDVCVAIGLSRLVGVSVADTAMRFNIGPSTVSTITRRFCQVTVNVLFPVEVVMPTTRADVQKNIDAFFAICAIPQVFAAVDATHVMLYRKPSKTEVEMPHSYYCSRKHRFTLNVQGTVDAHGMFIEAHVKFSGSTHDSNIFRDSGLCRIMSSVNAIKEPHITVGHTVIPPMVLADGGYPALPFILKRYHNKKTRVNATAAERLFDQAHSRGRVVVENSWARLKGRFGLLTRLSCSIGDACHYVASCIALHNFIERHHEEYEAPIDGEEDEDQEDVPDTSAHPTSKVRRDALLSKMIEAL